MHTFSLSVLRQLQREDAGVLAAFLKQFDGEGPPRATYSWEALCERLDVALAGLPNPLVSLQAGQVMSTRALPVLGTLISSAPTTRAVLRATQRFSPLVLTGSRFQLEEAGEQASLAFELPPAPARVTRAAVEFVLAFSHRVTHEVCPPGSGGIRGAEVRHPAPAHAEHYEALLGFPVRFAAERNAYWFESRDLDVPLPGGDDALFEVLCARAETTLVAQSSSWALRVKQQLRETPWEVSLASVAAQLKLSGTVLQRRLRAEKTSLSELIDEVRKEIAMDHIGEPDLNIKALTERLGFSEPSAFYRAFRRWTGHTPREYRQARGL